MKIHSIIILKKPIKTYRPNQLRYAYCFACQLVLKDGVFWWRSDNYMFYSAKKTPLSYERRKLQVKNFQRRTQYPTIYKKQAKGFFQEGLYIYLPFYKRDILRQKHPS